MSGFPMSRAKQQAAEISFQHLLKTENVVRIEAERREAKARLKLLDVLVEEIDDQLVFVTQFKKLWLQQRVALEDERQKVIDKEEEARQQMEELYVYELNEVLRLIHGA
ncbi:hypothetical protein STCU_03766 [Strigomonas culicis]|uniref:Uncharacterized protein n=1 Tax=Strigomonas culicis TaxID=28005 RepID=S9UJE7_9TRYP|nr:hypothetical protein STCU_04690 [Strigomonas culicis]EPY30937.1 hypothetical protein STCU_03766 [Strigomonas culicis]|eukprot:EPY29170.1 hypothetical protein STCU_04690 [Strigomonas culicis]